MIDLDELQAAINRCEFDGDVLGLSKAECSDLLGRLLKAEKDAERYRFMRDMSDNIDVSGFFWIDVSERDAFVDEAMQCK